MPENLPHTITSLAADLRALGLQPADTVLVHTSLGQIGYTAGGAEAVVRALLNVVGSAGNLVMPTFTNQAGYADPLEWRSPPVPEAWARHLRQNLPRFNPATTPSVNMGVVAELFRTFPGVKRNSHPVVSYAAHGPQADFILADHSLALMDGERSPLARVYDLDGKILLLGVDYDSCTAIHLATHRQKDPPHTTISLPTWDETGRVQWQRVTDVVNPGDMPEELVVRYKIGFNTIGAAFEQRHEVARGLVGSAEARLIRQRRLVDFATDYFNAHPYQED